MKKFKYLLVLLMAILFVPFVVNAEGEEANDNKVNVYLFRGEGCPHCQEAEEWFQSIQEEYGSKFTVVDYETWYDDDNNELMKKVADARGEEANGVPYIIIGNKSWNGFTESYESEMIEEINSEYEKDVNDRYDIMKLLPDGSKTKKAKKDSSGDVIALVVILLVVGGVCTGVYFARNNTK